MHVVHQFVKYARQGKYNKAVLHVWNANSEDLPHRLVNVKIVHLECSKIKEVHNRKIAEYVQLENTLQEEDLLVATIVFLDFFYQFILRVHQNVLLAQMAFTKMKQNQQNVESVVVEHSLSRMEASRVKNVLLVSIFQKKALN